MLNFLFNISENQVLVRLDTASWRFLRRRNWVRLALFSPVVVVVVVLLLVLVLVLLLVLVVLSAKY